MAAWAQEDCKVAEFDFAILLRLGQRSLTIWLLFVISVRRHIP